MAKKLTVPQSGTQPAASPLDNLLNPAAAPVKTQSQKCVKSLKKRTSINLDESIYDRFKVYCAIEKKSISGLLEQAMVDIMDK